MTPTLRMTGESRMKAALWCIMRSVYVFTRLLPLLPCCMQAVQALSRVHLCLKAF